MDNLAIGFCIGWAFGSLLMWAYFVSQKLIRNKKEWVKANKKR